jgi:hypothetical protein
MSNSKETQAQRTKRLEKELSDEKLKNKVLNNMIDFSDKHYGTQIRKSISPTVFRLHQQELWDII